MNSDIQIFLVLFVPYILLVNYIANFFDEIAKISKKNFQHIHDAPLDFRVHVSSLPCLDHDYHILHFPTLNYKRRNRG